MPSVAQTTGGAMYRDRLAQHLRMQNAGGTPESSARAIRARALRNDERAVILTDLWEQGDEDGFDALLIKFWRDDDQILWALNTRVASFAALRLRATKGIQ